MDLRCLLFSSDERAVRLLRLSLDDLCIEVEHCFDLGHAQELLLQRKFDGVVADCELADGPELLRSVRRSKHNRRSIIFALTGDEITMGEAFEMGAHFVIHKPMVSERVKRTLSAAHGLMMREKRSHYRHPARTPATMKIGQRPPLTMALCDLSQHGALIDAGTVLKRGQPVQLRFTLPETSYTIEAEGVITWSDPSGRAGVRFESLKEDAQSWLMEWAVQRSAEPKPQSAAQSQASKAAVEPQTSPMDFDIEVIPPQEETTEEPEGNDARLRSTLRAQHNAALKILTFEQGLPVIVQGRCQNLSELGLAASVDEELGIGEPVLLQVDLPGAQKKLVLHATVRHREDERYGFEFVVIDEAIRELLRECVTNLPVE